ncbi:MAG: hypothetical protein GX191_00955 [Candidatus Methanoculleus thermohydrogenotrophicum]|nr:hypothetical protein [Candidatus Methanoculleus thermohydrogenotrophicum]
MDSTPPDTDVQIGLNSIMVLNSYRGIVLTTCREGVWVNLHRALDGEEERAGVKIRVEPRECSQGHNSEMRQLFINARKNGPKLEFFCEVHGVVSQPDNPG